MTDLSPPALCDFADPSARAAWYPMNDTVMGGRSRGGPSFEQDRLVFSGVTNTQGGGFSSIRVPLPKAVLREAEGLRVRAKSDGRDYQASFTTDARIWGMRVSFRAPLDLHSPSQWLDAVVRFQDLRATLRGRPKPKARFDPARVETFGFFIFDRRDGPFRLEVEHIAILALGR